MVELKPLFCIFASTMLMAGVDNYLINHHCFNWHNSTLIITASIIFIFTIFKKDTNNSKS